MDSDAVVIVTDRTGAQTFVSANVQRIFGYTPADLLAFESRSLIHPDDIEPAVQQIEALLTETPGSTSRARLRFRHADGTWRLVANELVYVGAGDVGLVMRISDVTEETDLRAWYDLTFAEQAQALLVLLPDGTIRAANPAARRLFGLDGPPSPPTTLGDLLLPHPGVPNPCPTALWKGKPGQEVTARRTDGSTFPARVSASPLRFRGEGAFVTMFEDLSEREALRAAAAELEIGSAVLERTVRERTTELQAAAAQLAHANVTLQQANVLKDQFLTNMSHELRTPLNSVLGLAESLREGTYGPTTPDQQAALDELGDSGHHLLALVNDLLDLARMEAGALEVELQPTSADDLCDASIALVRPLARKKGITLSRSWGGPVELLGDARRLTQVVVNLLANAVKFTPTGGRVGVDVRLSADAEYVELVVWDTGAGIEPAHLDSIFLPFVQGSVGSTGGREGSGLGLALVRRLVELHNGEVEAFSSPSGGSRFVVRLPAHRERGHRPPPPRPPSAPRPAPPRAHAGEPRRVLLADDDPTNVTSLRTYLCAHGHTVDVARDGLEAVESVARLHPDVVLMDLQMPGQDGLTAIRNIRAREAREGGRTTIVALTALAMAGDRERSLDAGADAYVSKPARFADLADLIGQLSPSTRPPREDGASPADPSGAPR